MAKVNAAALSRLLERETTAVLLLPGQYARINLRFEDRFDLCTTGERTVCPERNEYIGAKRWTKDQRERVTRTTCPIAHLHYSITKLLWQALRPGSWAGKCELYRRTPTDARELFSLCNSPFNFNAFSAGLPF